MAASDKNIVISPQRGSTTSQPSIVFTGNGNDPITLRVLDDIEGALSFEGSSGQLFGISNNLSTGSIFSANYASGIPAIDVDAGGVVSIVPTAIGSVAIGKSTVTAGHILDVKGNVRIDGNITITQTTTISGLNADKLDGQDSSYYTNASNLSTGTLSSDRLPNTITKNITFSNYINQGPSLSYVNVNSPTAKYYQGGLSITTSGVYRGVAFSGSKYKYFELEADIKGLSATNHQGFFWGLNSVGGLLLGGGLTGYKTTHQSGTYFHIRDIAANSNKKTINPGFAPDDAQWHHFKVSAMPDGRVRVYIDGDLKINEEGYIPSDPGYVGFINYTGTAQYANIRFRSVQGGEGSGIDADLFDGQDQSYYLDASNISAGTIDDARLPNSISSSITGNAATATKLATARNIGGVSFDGSKDINLPGVDTAGSQDTSGNAATATKLATARNIGGVSFDGSKDINLPGVDTAGSQDTSGNAATATKLATARNIGGVSFDGSKDINLPGVNTAGDQNTSGNAATATKLATARNIGGVSFDGSKDINLPGVNTAGDQNTSGNAATATKLATARNIGGVSFDGSGDINLPGVNQAGNQNTSGNAATATKFANTVSVGGNAFDGSSAIYTWRTGINACRVNNAAVIAYSSQHNSSRGAANVIDGKKNFENGSNDWLTAANARNGAYVTIDLKSSKSIDRAVIYNQNEYPDSKREVKDFRLQGSNDNANWTTVLDAQLGKSNAHEPNPGWSFRIPNNFADDNEGSSYRYWKFIMDSFHGNDPYGGIMEIELYQASDSVDDEVSTSSLVSQDVYSQTGHFSRGVTIGSDLGGYEVGENELLIQSAAVIGNKIRIVPYNDINSGTLSFEGSAGQLFSITNNLTSGSIFSVNDVSGIPSIDVDVNGLVQIAPFGGTVSIGKTSVTSGYIADIEGNLRVNGTLNVTGDITAPVATQSKNGLFSSSDKAKLDGIASGAQVNVATNLSYTANNRVLASSTGTNVTLPTAVNNGDAGLMTGADKKKLDEIAAGAEVNVQADWNQTSTTSDAFIKNKPSIPTVNNGTLTVEGDSGLTGTGTFTANQSTDATITISHADTSIQASVNNSNGSVIQDVSLDGYGHVTGLVSTDLDTRYLGISAKAADSSKIDGINRPTLEESLARMAGWVPTYSNSNETSVVWNFTEDAVEIRDPANDTTIGATYKAIRMRAGEKIKILFQMKGSAVSSIGVYARLYFYNGDLPDGKTHVSNSASHTLVQEDSSGVTNWYENSSISQSWTRFTREYTAQADGYLSLVILNWSGYTGSLYVKQPDIQFVLDYMGGGLRLFGPGDSASFSNTTVSTPSNQSGMAVGGPVSSSTPIFVLNTGGVRTVTSNYKIDLFSIDTINYWFLKGGTSGSTWSDSPDSATENLELQYSTDNSTWVTIIQGGAGYLETPNTWVQEIAPVPIEAKRQPVFLRLKSAGSASNQDGWATTGIYAHTSSIWKTKYNSGWDVVANQDTTTRVGINTDVARQPLHVEGNAAFMGYVGIGTTNLSYPLQVWGSGNRNISVASTNNGASGIYLGTSTAPSAAYILYRPTLSRVDFGINGGSRIVIKSTSEVGIGTLDPSQKLHVIGNILASGNITAYSDETLKTNIKTIDHPLEKITSLRGVEFNRTDLEGSPKQIGVIAQEVEEVLPEVVESNENGIKSVSYGNMVGLLIEAIKVQQTQIKELLNRVEELENGAS